MIGNSLMRMFISKELEYRRQTKSRAASTRPVHWTT